MRFLVLVADFLQDISILLRLSFSIDIIKITVLGLGAKRLVTAPITPMILSTWTLVRQQIVLILCLDLATRWLWLTLLLPAMSLQVLVVLV